MFTLTTGSFRQIEAALLQDIDEQRKNNPLTPLLVVSPSGHMLTRLQTQLAARCAASLNIHFVSFYGLADRLTAETAPTDRMVSDPAIYSEIIRDLLADESDVPFTLRKELIPANHPLPKGLPEALASTLRDLRDSGARVVDSLRAALEGHLGQAAPEAAPALELYARLYEVLQKHGLRTSADQLRRAGQQISKSTWIKNQAAVFLYGFYDLTGVQQDFVMAFSRHPQARLYAPFVAGAPAYAFAERLLKDPAFTSKVGKHIDLTKSSPRQKPGSSSADVLDTGFRRYDDNSPQCEIWNCSGLHDEVWLTAKKVLELADQGIPYSRMLVSARSLGPYLSMVREIFETHHIPYSLEHEEPVGSYPLIKAARQLLRLAGQDFPIGTTIDVVKSTYFSERQSPDFDPNRWEQIARSAGIVTGWTSWEERLSHWSKQDFPEDYLESTLPGCTAAQAKQSAKRMLATLDQLRRDLSLGEGTRIAWGAHTEWAGHIFKRWLRLPTDATAEERRLFEGLQSALQGLSSLDALEKPITRSHFLETWEKQLESLTLSLAPVNNQGVQVLDVMAARGLSFDAVFLLGLNEKSFPRLIREDPFLSDKVRGALSEALGCRLPRKLDGYQEERLLFVLAQEMAEKHLHLSYQRSDEEGKALVPSIYLHEWVRAEAPRFHLARVLGQKWNQVSWSELTSKEISILLNRERRDPEDLYRAFHYDTGLYHALREAQSQIDSFQEPLGPRDGLTGPRPFIKRIMERGFSPDSLKDLAECPFRYYAGKVLGLRPGEDAEKGDGDLTAEASGKLIHSILEAFYRNLGKDTAYTNKIALQKSLDDACTKVFASFQDTALDLYPLAWIATQQKIRARLHDFINVDVEEISESRFIPTYFEENIAGEMAETTPFIISTLFRGRVDRIDIKQEKGRILYRVVDYKTGNPTKKGTKTETQILRGGHLQLPVYLSLVRPWLEKKLGQPVEAVQASFYNLADWEKGQESPAIGPDFWGSTGRLFAENLAGLLSLPEQGIFYIRPSEDQEYCSWCEFKHICRKEHKPSVVRSEASPIRRANDKRLSRKAEA